MDDKKIKRLIKETLEGILSKHNIKLVKIILFGSRARGEGRSDSDWDILVIVGDKPSRKDKIMLCAEITRELAEYFIPCDILIRSSEEVEKLKEWIHSATKTALKEGIAL